jgi:hypothetical protein
MAGLLSEARVAVHPLPSDEEFDSASSRFDASIYYPAIGICLLNSCNS